MGSILIGGGPFRYFVFSGLEITRKNLEKKTNNYFKLGYVCSDKFEFKKTRQLKLKFFRSA